VPDRGHRDEAHAGTAMVARPATASRWERLSKTTSEASSVHGELAKQGVVAGAPAERVVDGGGKSHWCRATSTLEEAVAAAEETSTVFLHGRGSMSEVRRSLS
jgi:hypothetical protein